jgi:hypothetical protein
MEKIKYCRRHPRSFSYFLTTTLLLLSALFHVCHTQSIHPRSTHHKAVSWDHDTPKEAKPELGKLVPTKCWKKRIEAPFECYYLHAPLDYLSTSDDRTAKLAVVKYPAGGGKTPKEDILGTLLINFGGPGGAGVGGLTHNGPRYNGATPAEAFDLMMNGRYNIISWDVSRCRGLALRALLMSMPSCSYTAERSRLFNATSKLLSQ